MYPVIRLYFDPNLLTFSMENLSVASKSLSVDDLLRMHCILCYTIHQQQRVNNQSDLCSLTKTFRHRQTENGETTQQNDFNLEGTLGIVAYFCCQNCLQVATEMHLVANVPD